MPVTVDVKPIVLQLHNIASTDSQGVSFEPLALFVWVVTVKAMLSLGVIKGTGFPLDSLQNPPHPHSNENTSLTQALLFCLDSDSIGLLAASYIHCVNIQRL